MIPRTMEEHMSTQREPYTPPGEPVAVSAVQEAELVFGLPAGGDLGSYSSFIP